MELSWVNRRRYKPFIKELLEITKSSPEMSVICFISCPFELKTVRVAEFSLRFKNFKVLSEFKGFGNSAIFVSELISNILVEKSEVESMAY